MKEESLYTGSSITVDERLSLKKIRWRLSERLAGLKEMALSRGELLLLGMLGFLLGRATLMGEVATFGAIFWLVLLREKPLQSYLVAATVLLGRATVLGWLSTGHLLVAIFLIWVWRLCACACGRKKPLVVSVVLLMYYLHPYWFPELPGLSMVHSWIGSANRVTGVHNLGAGRARSRAVAQDQGSS